MIKQSELIQLNGHILYKVHECTKECTSKDTKTCKEKNKLVFPKEPIPIKFLHLFLKKEKLYSGIECFLHLMLRCLLQTHAETVAESMGYLVAMHCEKRQRLGIEDSIPKGGCLCDSSAVRLSHLGIPLCEHLINPYV